MVVIKSKKFILRPFKKGDEKSLQKNINDKEIYRYTLRIPHPYRLKDAKNWIKQCSKLSKKKNKTSLNFAIDIESEVIGGIGLDAIDNYKAEIGYWLSRRLWNQSIVTESVRLITNLGFKKLKLKRIYAHVVSKNNSSIRVLKKNGYKLEGTLKKHHFRDGRFMDIIILAKTKK